MEQLGKRLCLEREFPHEIGVFFISPCAAKVTEGKSPLALDSSGVDGIFSINDLYPRLLKEMNKIDTPMQLASSGIVGLSWPLSGGESREVSPVIPLWCLAHSVIIRLNRKMG